MKERSEVQCDRRPNLGGLERGRYLAVANGDGSHKVVGLPESRRTAARCDGGSAGAFRRPCNGGRNARRFEPDLAQHAGG